MLNIIVNKIREKSELENRYGWVSCFDAPEAYNEMGKLAGEIEELCEEVVQSNLDHNGFAKFLPETLRDVLYYINGHFDSIEGKELVLYTQDEYIETYVLGGISEDAREVFDNLFYYMNSDERAGWLHSHYIDHDECAFADEYVDFVIMAYEA